MTNISKIEACPCHIIPRNYVVTYKDQCTVAIALAPSGINNLHNGRNLNGSFFEKSFQKSIVMTRSSACHYVPHGCRANNCLKEMSHPESID